MNFITATIFALSGILDPITYAAQPSSRSITCGDHWLNVTAVLDGGSSRATIGFDGESNPDQELRVGTYSYSSNDSVNVVFSATTSERLEIERTPSGNIFWGTYYPGAGQSSQELGMCFFK